MSPSLPAAASAEACEAARGMAEPRRLIFSVRNNYGLSHGLIALR